MKVVGGINDDKIFAALRSGNVPDIVSSFTSSNVGIYCSSGGWIDLAPLPEAGPHQRQHLPDDVALLHAVQGHALRAAAARRRRRPLLQQDALQEGRAHRPAEDARGADRRREEADAARTPTARSRSSASTRSWASTRTAGAARYQPLFGGKYFDTNGKSSLAHRPGLGEVPHAGRRASIDYYGYDKLVRWQTGAGDEFSASHAFETGKLAMMLDGEWRVAFIANEHPELQYATAPMPVADATRALRRRLHQRHDHRHPEGRQEPRRRRGRSSST